ncbi:uncharacterized protein LOC106092246 [Stomoxys calcitrans]|uniref:RING-type domain-containing protein n=1 Tax=Stomoxys calcitrans TaxID=35570 RepID=A0A1I8NNJ3_STOCA|nr:uncharacterized protein LOC106092246 [Stomoxys calcitrans]
MDLIFNLVSDFVVQVFDFGYLLTWITLRLTSILILVTQFFYHLLESVANGVHSVLDYLPLCDDGIFQCGVDAAILFSWNLRDFYSNIKDSMSMWQILVVGVWLLLIVWSHNLRKILCSWIAFMIVGSYAVLRKLVSRRKPTQNPNKTFSTVRLVVLIFSTSFSLVKGVSKFFFRGPRKTTTTNADPDLVCVICYERPKSVLLFPCKHVCLCGECSTNVMNDRMLQYCPLCRELITKTMNVYL